MLYIVAAYPAYAQLDSVTKAVKQPPSVIKQLIVPASLITVGSLVSGSTFEKSVNKDVRNFSGNNFNTKADDYLRYIPVVELYAADVFGIKAKNHWFDQTKNLAISLAVSNLITTQLKKMTQKKRPYGGEVAHSFPSAHSTIAFTNATVLYEEFRDTSPLLAYSGYGFATATGSLRLMNNAHWLSDVMVGAGIGILVTKIVYALDPLLQWNPFLNTKGVTVIPQVNDGQYGLYVSKKL